MHSVRLISIFNQSKQNELRTVFLSVPTAFTSKSEVSLLSAAVCFMSLMSTAEIGLVRQNQIHFSRSSIYCSGMGKPVEYVLNRSRNTFHVCDRNQFFCILFLVDTRNSFLKSNLHKTERRPVAFYSEEPPVSSIKLWIQCVYIYGYQCVKWPACV